jgi:hypothetical protein
MKMILPRGITGFNVLNDHVITDSRCFKADCWQVVIPLHGRVEDRRQLLDTQTPSFITQILVQPGGEVTALLNKVHPWVGFCLPLVPGNAWLEFVDPGPLSEAFDSLGRYRVLSRSDLEQPIKESMCVELHPGEMKQLKYWREAGGPGMLRVGDVVFNFWD